MTTIPEYDVYESFDDFHESATSIVQRVEKAVWAVVRGGDACKEVRQRACVSLVASWHRIPKHPARQYGFIRTVVANEFVEHLRFERRGEIDNGIRFNSSEILMRLAGIDRNDRSVDEDYGALYEVIAKVLFAHPVGVYVLLLRNGNNVAWKDLEHLIGLSKSVLQRRLKSVKEEIRTHHPHLRAFLE